MAPDAGANIEAELERIWSGHRAGIEADMERIYRVLELIRLQARACGNCALRSGAIEWRARSTNWRSVPQLKRPLKRTQATAPKVQHSRNLRTELKGSAAGWLTVPVGKMFGWKNPGGKVAFGGALG